MRSFSHITYCTEYYYYYVFKFNGLIARAISSLERVAIIAVSYYSTFSVQRILPTRLSLGIFKLGCNFKSRRLLGEQRRVFPINNDIELVEHGFSIFYGTPRRQSIRNHSMPVRQIENMNMHLLFDCMFTSCRKSKIRNYLLSPCARSCMSYQSRPIRNTAEGIY